MNPILAELCDIYGIQWQYLDGAGRSRQAPEETCRALLQALVPELATEAERQLAKLKIQAAARLVPETVIVAVETEHRIGGKFPAATEWQLRLEDGTRLQGAARAAALVLPPLPLGIHVLTCAGQTSTILAAPPRLPPPPRGWGLMAPLYGLRGTNDDGIGNFQDLAELASAVAPLGAGFVGINPVHAGFPVDPAIVSPYSPSSRQWLNPQYIALAPLAEQKRRKPAAPPAGRNTDLVDYPAVLADKSQRLQAAFAAFREAPPDPDFEAFVANEGRPLRDFATHQALSEVYGPYWPDWPDDFQTPDSPASRRFAAEQDLQILYHSWLQWLARRQLQAAQDRAKQAGLHHGLYLDLAVGTHPLGAETWADAELFCRGVSIGSPSDAFSASGQNWGLAPFNPRELAARHYRPLAQTLRAQLRFCGLLRIDHILGFERSFWIPEGLPGAYVSFPREALLAVTRIEAARAGAAIVGEDLGNVPDGLRRDLDDAGLLGCRVSIFERNWKTDKTFLQAADYSERALASITTHDLPTLIGWWNASDIGWRKRLGEISEDQAAVEQSERQDDCQQFAALIGFAPSTNPSHDLSEADAEGLVLAAHRFLAETRSVLAAVQIEDVLGLSEQPNLPGTISEHPNWRRRLACPVTEIARLAIMGKIAHIMKAARRSAPERSHQGGVSS